MSEKAVSTAVSDLVLAGCSFYAAVSVHGKSVYAAWGFMCVSIAASFGVLKFGVVFPNVQSKVIRLHMLFTWIASTVGIPLIAAGFCFHHHKPANAKFHLGWWMVSKANTSMMLNWNFQWGMWIFRGTV